MLFPGAPGLACARRAAFAATTVTRRLLAYLALAASATAASPEATSIVAGHSETSIRTGETILTGDPHVDYGDLRLTADEIRLNPSTHVATATGHAIITQGPRRLLSDRIVYHSETGSFEVGDLRAGEFPVYASGASATGDHESLVVTDARVSLLEPGDLIPTLRAARVFFTADHRVRAEHAALGLGDVQPLSLPNISHDVRSSLVPNASLTGGYRRSLGVYGEIDLHLPITPVLKLGADLGLYSSRGIMLGPAGSYAFQSADTSYQGAFRSGFISDYGTRYTDVLGRPVPRNRGFAEWQHNQQIGDRITLVGDFNYWRDSEVLRDFRPSDFFNVQEPDNFVESVYSGNNYSVSFFARFQPNSFQIVQQRLPELRFDLLPTALPGGFYERFNASAAVLREDPLPVAPFTPVPGPKLRSDRLDAYYSLSRPIRPAEWLTFTPVAGGRITHYANLDGARNDYTRTLGEIGFDSELRASGTYDYKNPRWKIDGLRHLVTPRISYRYIPEAEKGARYIPPIDRRSFSTYLQPLGLGDIRNLDELHGTNTLRLGLDNTLQTRDPIYGSRDLLVFNAAADLRFDRRPGEREASEIHTEVGLTPARWLEVGVYSSFTPQEFTLRELNTGITLRDGDDWTLRFANNFLRGELNDYLVRGTHRFNEAVEGVVHLRYDARKRRFNEQAYGVRQNLANAWSIEYLVTIYEGPRREGHFGLNVRIDAIRF
jgi:LPS-assembly protein